MWVQRDGRNVKVKVRVDGTGLVSHAGSALVRGIADRVGLTAALSSELAGVKQRQRGHDPGRVIRDVAVMLADGGVSLSDLATFRDQEALFGEVASNATVHRMIAAIAADVELIEGLRRAHAAARVRAWALIGSPQALTIDIDATLVTAHSEKQAAAGTYKGGYGFHPLLAYARQSGEVMFGILRPGNAGARTAADHLVVLDGAIDALPAEEVQVIDLTLRADCAGATHELLDGARDRQVTFTVGYEITPAVRQALLELPQTAWTAAIGQDGTPRRNGQVAEITDRLNLAFWPSGSRVIVRRERAHPGAQLSFTDIDGHRFQAILTDHPSPHIEVLEARHRARAHVEDEIRADKDTGLSKFPFSDFAMNEVWLEIIMLAHNLLTWTAALLLDGQLQTAEPKRVRYTLLHTAARLTFTARQAILHLPAHWPWARELQAAFARLAALPPPAG